MAYDRFDRDERSRWSEDRGDDRFGRNWRGDDRGPRGERGFWDRASDEVASWFGDDDAERRRRQDNRRDESMGDNDRNWRGNDRDWQHDRERAQNRDFDRGFRRDFGRDRGEFGRDQSSFGGGRSDRDFNEDRRNFARSSRRDWNENRDFERGRERFGSGGGYRPMAGDYGRSERDFGDFEQHRRTSFAGPRDRDDREFDPHYSSWRDRHMSDLDRDYDDYRREHQSKFENDFTSWREKRQHKRGLLGQIREHMEVVGNDGQHVGTVDKIAGDRIILTKSDPESGGAHHSLSCSDIDRVEGDKVILDCPANEAKNRWRDESRGRALFERDDQGEMGPRGLNRSFEGTYR